MTKEIKKKEKSFTIYEGSSWIGIGWIFDIFELIFDIIGAFIGCIFKGLD